MNNDAENEIDPEQKANDTVDLARRKALKKMMNGAKYSAPAAALILASSKKTVAGSPPE